MSQRKDRLEVPTIDESPTPAPAIDQGLVESEITESEPFRESTDTVRQLMDAWKDEYDQTDEPGRKNELAYRLVRMAEAVQAAHLSPSEVKIREAEAGVLAFYVPDSGEIAITPAGLELPPGHFKDVLIHEATHAGKMSVRRIADEGLTQLHTESRVSGAMPGIYPAEKKDAEIAFGNMGIERVLETYNFDKPQELIDLYLSVEWNEEWKNKWQVELGDEAGAVTESGRKEAIEGVMKEWLKKLEDNFKAAAPRLLANAETQGFDFSEAHEREFARVVKEEGKK